MAERRMFSKSIIDSDLFLDMPQSTQLLYFHLSMRADDDGFINNPKSIIRNTKCNEDDLKLLIVKKFVIAFESGIIVIRHWKQHNYIQKDRYRPTIHRQEIEQLTLENGVYMNCCIQNVSNMDTKCIQIGYNMDTQVSKELVKESLNKENINTICVELDKPDTTPQPIIHLVLNDKTLYPIYQTDIDKWQDLYQAVDVIQELKAMSGWLDANSTKRKTKQGIKRFVNNWLSRKQDKGGTKSYESSNKAYSEYSSSAKLY